MVNEKSLANLDDRRKHGVYEFQRTGLISCRGCIFKGECGSFEEDAQCEPLADFIADKMDFLMNLPQFKGHPEFSMLAELICREQSIQYLVCRWTSRVGLFQTKNKDLNFVGIMKQYWVSVNSLSRLLNSAGLTPASQKLIQGNSSDAWNTAQQLAGMSEGNDNE